MKSGWKVGAGAVLGFALGLLVAPGVHSSTEPSGERSTEQGGSSKNPNGETDDPVRRTRSSRSPAKPSEPKVSIPLSEAAKLIRGRLGNGIVFFSSARDESGFGKEKVNEALTLLDATDAEREEVLSIFERTGANILKAEMANLRVKEVTPHEVVLDATRVREPVKEVLAQMKSELGAAMAGPRGQALVDSIAWDYAHPTQAAAVDPNGVPASEPAPYRLQIVLSQGQLMARCHTERGWTSYPLPAKYLNDGSAIPAGEVFGERWKSITSGVSLLPLADP